MGYRNTPAKKDYSWVWFIPILIVTGWLCNSSGGPEYPNDPQSFGNEYQEDMLDTNNRTYDPGSRYDSEIQADQTQWAQDNQEYLWQFQETQEANSPTTCNIKGNIAFDTGEKIYHMPGQEYYSATTIDPAYGERWFCSEAEARAAGWRKASQ